jgi:hypothetical protein
MAPCPPTAVKSLSIYKDFRAVSAFTYAIRPLLPDGHGVQSKSNSGLTVSMLATGSRFTHKPD